MANKTATMTFQLTYVGPDGDQVVMPQRSIQSSYQAQEHGSIDIPDATAAATVYNVPFGGITLDAEAGLIENRTGQPLEAKINGAAAASQTIPNGGVFAWANPVVSGGTPILSISLETTAMQSGVGYINYHLFGDPT